MNATVAVLTELLASASETVVVDVLLLSDRGGRYLVDRDGVSVMVDSRDVIDFSFNSEMDVSLTLPRAVAMEKGLC